MGQVLSESQNFSNRQHAFGYEIQATLELNMWPFRAANIFVNEQFNNVVFGAASDHAIYAKDTTQSLTAMDPNVNVVIILDQH